MITHDNFKYLVETIDIETVKEAMEGPKDYILLECHTFNVESYATIENVDYDEDTEREAQDNGNIFTDKDSFSILCADVEAFEY